MEDSLLRMRPVQHTTDAYKREANLATNMILVIGGIIPTNTPAFQSYAFEMMASNSQFVAASWRETSQLPTNRITFFRATPTPWGPSGAVIFDGRFGFRYSGGRLAGFSDGTNDTDFLMTGNQKEINEGLKHWLNTKDLLTRQRASNIAVKALQCLGISPQAINGGKPPLVEQLPYEWGDETRLAPYYIVEWRTNNSIPLIRIEVSGMTGKIAAFENNTSFARIPPSVSAQ